MTYRWLIDEEVIEQVNPVLQERGWSLLNLPTSRVLGAFDDERLVEVFVLQLYPLLGPMVRVDNTYRDNGDTSRELARQMEAFLRENEARGTLAIANSPATVRLCERFGMQRVESPVFIDTLTPKAS